MALLPAQPFSDDQWRRNIHQAMSREETGMIATMQPTEIESKKDSSLIVASLDGVTKNYGAVRALHAVNFGVRAGQAAARAYTAELRQGARLRRQPYES
jgi:hypothetical protein